MSDLVHSEKEKRPNGFVRFVRRLFVKNWGLKLAAILSAVALWCISVGLGL